MDEEISDLTIDSFTMISDAISSGEIKKELKNGD